MKLQDIRKALEERFFERSELIEGMLVALISKEMLFMLGQPGTGKSAICDALCSIFKGRFFTWLLSKFTTPEEIFGPLSLKALENDKYERVTTGKLPEADVAFLDEIFKGSSAILNTLLPIINERIFHNGTSPTKIPLQVVFGASNEIPQAEELAALYDRFALRFIVSKISDASSVKGLFDMAANGRTLSPMPTLTVKELEAEQKLAAEVKVPDQIINILVKLRTEVEEKGIQVSDRRWVQSIRILKAYAHLDGSTEVKEDHLSILKNVLWSAPEQQKQIAKMVNSISNPLGADIQMIMDGVEDIYSLLKKGQEKPEVVQQQVKDAKVRLKKLGDPNTNKKLKEAIAKVNKINLDICKGHLGLDLDNLE